MNPRRITLTLGAAAGGLLAAASLPMAVAFADDFGFGADPSSTETVVGVSGIPPLGEDIHGTQLIDLNDTTTNTVVTSFNSDVSDTTTAFGLTNSEIIVTGTTAGPALFPPGTVFESTNFASGWDNTYSDVVGTGGAANTITDTFNTPFGTYTIPTTFDASAAYFSAPAAFVNGNFVYTPDASGETVTSIGGIAPLSQTVSGTQLFDVDQTSGSAEALVGQFNADVTTRSSMFGTSSEQIAVTSDAAAGTTLPDGTVVTGADEPPVHSVFDTVNFGSGWENIYSDVAGSTTSADTVTDTFVTPYGNFNIPTDFDASATFDQTVDFVNGNFTYVPDTTSSAAGENFTSVGGVPPLWETVSGTQLFDVGATTSSGTSPIIGQFFADETTLSTAFGLSNEQIVVTSDLATGPWTVGTADEPSLGSVFDVTNFGSGWENIFSDVAGSTTSADTITDTLVTPFGDFNLPIDFDVAALFGL